VARLALHFCEIVLTVVHSVADGPKLGENVVDTASQKQENLEAHAPMRWRQPAGHHTADAIHRAKKAPGAAEKMGNSHTGWGMRDCLRHRTPCKLAPRAYTPASSAQGLTIVNSVHKYLLIGCI
jgi:hypothetical protein